MPGETTLHRWLWQHIRSALTQEVPEQDGLCEFDCPHLQCSMAKWRSCENRLRDLSLNSIAPSVVRPEPRMAWRDHITGMLGGGVVTLVLSSAIYFVYFYLLR